MAGLEGVYLSENRENCENSLGLWLGCGACISSENYGNCKLVKIVKMVCDCGWAGGCVPR